MFALFRIALPFFVPPSEHLQAATPRGLLPAPPRSIVHIKCICCCLESLVQRLFPNVVACYLLHVAMFGDQVLHRLFSHVGTKRPLSSNRGAHHLTIMQSRRAPRAIKTCLTPNSPRSSRRQPRRTPPTTRRPAISPDLCACDSLRPSTCSHRSKSQRALLSRSHSPMRLSPANRRRLLTS